MRDDKYDGILHVLLNKTQSGGGPVILVCSNSHTLQHNKTAKQRISVAIVKKSRRKMLEEKIDLFSAGKKGTAENSGCGSEKGE